MGLGSYLENSKEKDPILSGSSLSKYTKSVNSPDREGWEMELVKTVKDPPFPPPPFVCMLVSAWLCFIESGEPNVWWLGRATMTQCRVQ